MTPQMCTTVIKAQPLPGGVPECIVLQFPARPIRPVTPPRWPWAVAATAMLGLLLGFCLVVREIEKQGERRRQATAMHAHATWRCNALPGRLARANCLKQLNAPFGKEVPVQVAAQSRGG